MIKEIFYNIIYGKSEVSNDHVQDIESMLEKHPYFHLPFSYFARQHSGNHNNTILEDAAISTCNRSRLKEFVSTTWKESDFEFVEENDEVLIEDDLPNDDWKAAAITTGVAGTGVAALANGFSNGQNEEALLSVNEDQEDAKEAIETETDNGIESKENDSVFDWGSKSDEEPISDIEDSVEEKANDIVEDIQDQGEINLDENESQIQTIDGVDDEQNEIDITQDSDEIKEDTETTVNENIIAEETTADNQDIIDDEVEVDENELSTTVTEIENENESISDLEEIDTAEEEIEDDIEEDATIEESVLDDTMEDATEEAVEIDRRVNYFEKIEEHEITRSSLLAKIGNALPVDSDDLTVIDGIDDELKSELYKNDIYSFRQLKNCSNVENKAQLAELLNLNVSTIIEQNWDGQASEHYAQKYQHILIDKVGHSDYSKADDLKKVNGIGPVLEKKLNDVGIFNFTQLAAMSEKDTDILTELIGYFPGRIERDDWVNQAKRKLEINARMERAANEADDTAISFGSVKDNNEDPALEALRQKLRTHKELKEESPLIEELISDDEVVADEVEELSIEESSDAENAMDLSQESNISFEKETATFDFSDADDTFESDLESDLGNDLETDLEEVLVEEVTEEKDELLLQSEDDDIDDAQSFTSWLSKIDTKPEDEEEEETDEDGKKKLVDFDSNEVEEEPRLVKIDEDNIKDIREFVGEKEEEKPKVSVAEIRENASKSLVEDSILPTETLAKIYEGQEYYKKAIKVYEKLVLLYPEKSLYFAARIDDLKKK